LTGRRASAGLREANGTAVPLGSLALQHSQRSASAALACRQFQQGRVAMEEAACGWMFAGNLKLQWPQRTVEEGGAAWPQFGQFMPGELSRVMKNGCVDKG